MSKRSTAKVPAPLVMNVNSNLAKRKIGQINFFYNNRKEIVTAKLSDSKTVVSDGNDGTELPGMKIRSKTNKFI